MEYRIKEVEVNGKKFFYPQWKKRWFWHRFTFPGGEDGTSKHTVVCTGMNDAIKRIAEDKENRRKKELETPNKPIYHYIN